MKKLIVLVMLTVVMLCGCDNVNTNPVIDNQQENQVSEIETNTINITGSPSDVQSYEIIGKYEVDLTDGESDDVITLYTSAERNDDGEIMWDDTQEWVIQVETDKGVYELYKEKIHGNVYMNVSDFYTEDSDKVAVTVIAATNASNEVREYIFEENSFTEYLVYTTDSIAKEGINPLYTTIPQYK